MWEAYLAGTIPVGAVVVDETGEVVSRARNRTFDDPRDGHLGGSRLAHAELNALVALTSERTYEGFTLYTTLEPCHLCLSAAISVRIGSLRYAAPDPQAGAVGKLVPSRDHEAHPLNVEGPLPGAPGRLAELLHLAHCLWRSPRRRRGKFLSELQARPCRCRTDASSPGLRRDPHGRFRCTQPVALWPK